MIIQDEFIDYKENNSLSDESVDLYKKQDNYFIFLFIGIFGGILCIFAMILIPYFLSSNHTKFMNHKSNNNQNHYYLNADFNNIPYPTKSL